VLSACFERADLGRAGEWTVAAMAWCESLETTTPFHGICRVHRVEVRALRGAWDEAEADGLVAEAELAELWPDMAAEALYAVGEVRRRRGDLAAAEDAFERAGRLGLDPQPGLALLRLDQGRPHAAEAALRLAGLGAGRSLLWRAGLLGARVEVALACGDRAGAREAASALAALAAEAGAPVLAAASAMTEAAVRLAEGDAEGALRAAGEAWTGWQELRLPHEAARARMLLGRASRAAGDEERARRELEAARAGFARLGAVPDERRAAALLARAPAGPAGLSAREVQVLRLVAAGRTNRQVAAELVLSEHTVARHLQNAFGKIGVSSRAAAVAYAVEHGLV
jgi:DNA-binding CsgD family transcriptional regulator